MFLHGSLNAEEKIVSDISEYLKRKLNVSFCMNEDIIKSEINFMSYLEKAAVAVEVVSVL